MKKYIFIPIYILFPLLAMAQLSVGYTALYGNYLKMGDMNQLIKNNLAKIINGVENQTPGIPNAAIVADFPDYIAHALDLNYALEREEFGFQITYMSTGGKIAYSDYSGEYVNKLTLKGIRIGTRYRYNFREFYLKEKQRLIFFGEISPGIILSTLKNKVYVEYPEKTVDERGEDNLSATGISLLPQVGIKTNFGRLGVHVIAGYDFDLGGKIDNEEQSKICWSGFRAGIGLSYTFGGKKENPEAEKNTK